MDYSKFSDKTLEALQKGEQLDYSALSDDELIELSKLEQPQVLAQPKVSTPEIPQEISKTESFVRGAGQGASFGFADELTGLLESLATDKTYEQARDESRAAYKLAEEANPMTSTAGSLIGGLAVPVPGATLLAPGAKAALASTRAMLPAKAASVLAKESAERVLGAGALGAAAGALGGAGTSEGETAKDVLKDTAGMAVTGGAAGGLLGAVGVGLGKAADAWKDSRFGKEIIDAIKYTRQDPEMFTSAGKVKTAQGLETAIKDKLLSDAVTNPRKAINEAYDALKLKAEAEGKILEFEKIQKIYDDLVAKTDVKNELTTKDMEKFKDLVNAVGKVEQVETRGRITPEMESEAQQEAARKLSSGMLAGETKLMEKVRSSEILKAKSAHEKTIKELQKESNSLQKEQLKLVKEAEKLEEQAKKWQTKDPQKMQQSLEAAKRKRNLADGYDTQLQEVRKNLDSIPELNLQDIIAAADEKAKAMLDAQKAKQLEITGPQGRTPKSLYPIRFERAEDDISGAVTYKATAEGVGEVPTLMSTQQTIKVPTEVRTLIGRPEITPKTADESLRKIDVLLDETKDPGVKRSLAEVKQQLKNMMYGENIESIAKRQLVEQTPDQLAKVPSTTPLAQAGEQDDAIIQLMDKLRSEGVTTPQDTMDAATAQLKYLQSVLKFPSDYGAMSISDKRAALDKITAELHRAAKKAAADPTSADARTFDKLEKAANDLADKGFLDKAALQKSVQEVKDLARKEYLHTVSEQEGMPGSGSWGRYLVAPLMSARATAVQYGAKGVVAAESTGIPRLASKLYNMPKEAVVSMAAKAEARGSKFGPQLRKIAEAPEQKRKALLFTLMQQPAFRYEFGDDSGE